jgi:hypothetical protein
VLRGRYQRRSVGSATRNRVQKSRTSSADRLTDRGGLFRRQRRESLDMSLRLDNNVPEVDLVLGAMDVSGVDEIVLEDRVPVPFA